LAIPLPADDETAVNVMTLSALIVVLMSVATGIFAFLFGDYLVYWAKAPALKHFLWLLPAGILMSGLYQVLNFWTVRRGVFKRIAQTKFSQSFGQAITQVVLGLFNVGALGLLIGDLFGRAGGSGTFALAFAKEDRRVLKSISWSGIKRVAGRYMNFPVLSGSSALLNSAATQLPAILLAGFFGVMTAGWFALGQRVVTAPLSFVSLSVSQVYTNEAARLARDDVLAFKDLYLRTAKHLFVVGIIPVLLLAVGGPWLFSVVFGEAWTNAGMFLRILSLMLVFQFVASPLSYTLDVLERLGWELGWNALRLVLSISGMMVAYKAGYSANVVVGIYSAIMALVYIALLIISYIAVQKHVDENIKYKLTLVDSNCA
jgi:O-antigen/teichoic acid export membrane protein